MVRRVDNGKRLVLVLLWVPSLAAAGYFLWLFWS